MRDPNDSNARSDQNALIVSADTSGSSRNELLNRLRAIIDDATQSVRTLKEENAVLAQHNRELEDRTEALEQRLRLLTAGITQDEQALRQSVDRLAQTLQMPVAPAAAPAQSAAASAPAPTPASAPDAPEPPPDAPPAAPPASEAAMPEQDAPPPAAEAPTAPEVATEPEPPVAREVPESPVSAPPPAPPVEPAPAATDHAASTGEMPAATTGGVYTLITYPFVRFSDLGQFQAALQRLQGVHDVQVRRFAQGTLEMTARYEGETSLVTALRGLTAEIEEVREEAPYRLRVRLRARTDA